MKPLGYVRVFPSLSDDPERLYLSVALQDAADFAEPIPDSVVCALVPVADLDVEQAVERAARACFHLARTDEARIHGTAEEFIPHWDEAPALLKHEQREHIRPIVLAALGVGP